MSDKNGSPKEKKSAFGNSEQVRKVCGDMQTTETLRALDRAKINALFNGLQPYSASECKKFGIQINVNWGEGKRIMADANRQLNSALIHDEGLMFNCTLEAGPLDKRQEWGMKFTANIHKPLQRRKSGKRHNFLIQNRNASVCLHGIGALLWTRQDRWMPRFVALEDLLIPTDTVVEFSNLRYFAVNLYLTPGEFADLTQGSSVKKGWNKKLCAKILDKTKYKVVPENSGSDFTERPEHMESVWKQNKGFFYCDAVEKIRLRAFYWQDVDAPQAWHRHIVLRDESVPGLDGVDTQKFIYDGNDEVFADDIDHILYCLYGDGNLVPPLKYHSVRGLGTDLYAPVETLNRYRCQFMQHCFEQLLMLFRIQDPADRDRLKQVVLSAYGFLPEGLNFVTAKERHQIDPNLAAAAMNQMRQIMQENSSAFVRDADKGNSNEMTAREAMIRLNQANMMISSMLSGTYTQENIGYYTELVRRFCNKQSTDKQVVAFRKQCIKDGIPEEMLDPEKWKISPEKVLGGGDRTTAQLEADWLWQNRTAFDPTAQRMIMRKVTATMLNNPSMANELVPETLDTDTEGSRAAEDVFGSLMQGAQIGIRTGIDFEGYVVRLLTMMGMVVKRIQGTDNMGSQQDILGLMNCAANVELYLQTMVQDQTKKQLVKQLADVLGKLTNEIKGFAQRLKESEQQGDPELESTIQTQQALAASKLQISQAGAQQKAQQRQQSHEQKLLQASEKHRLQLDSLTEKTTADLEVLRAKTEADIAAMMAGADAEIQIKQQQSAADITAKKALAAASKKKVDTSTE